MAMTSRHTDQPATDHLDTCCEAGLGDSTAVPAQGVILDLCDQPLTAPSLDELHDCWSSTSRMRLGLSRQQWHHPATLDLVGAMAAGDDLTEALRGIGEARAGAGLSLEETLADLGVLAELAPSAHHAERELGIGRVDTLQAASAAGTAWAEGFYGEVTSPGCTDPMTGLVTGSYLQARLGQLYLQSAAAGRRVDREYVLVVVQIQCRDLSPFSCIAKRIHAAGQLRAALPAADTIAVLEPTHAMVALVEDRDTLAEELAALGAEAPEDAVWVEHLGSGVAEAQALVRELAAIPRMATIAHRRSVRHP